MKLLTFFLLSLITFTSCRKDFASFQKAPSLSYTTQKKNREISSEVRKIEQPTLVASTNNSFVFAEPNDPLVEASEIILAKTPKIDDGGRRKRKKIDKKNETFIEKIFPNQHSKDNKSVKKRRRPVPFNSNIYTGFIILGLAILLALVSLNSLSLLFGVAAIFFLYLGFKKYFRKKRRRDIFR